MTVVLSLAAAVFFAGQLVVLTAALRFLPPPTVLWYSTMFGFVASVGWIVVFDSPTAGSLATILGLLLAGTFAPLIGRALFLKGLQYLGSNVSSPIVMAHPVVAVILAVVLLQEPVDVVSGTGGMLAVAGSVVIAYDREHGDKGHRTSLTLLFPLLSCVAFGISLVIRKVMMLSGVDSVFAAMVVLAPAFVGYSCYYLAVGDLTAFRLPEWRGVTLLMLGGVVASVAAIFWLAAIRSGSLVVAAPLASTSPLFALLFVKWFLPRSERFSTRIVVGTVMTVVGVALTAYGSNR